MLAVGARSFCASGGAFGAVGFVRHLRLRSCCHPCSRLHAVCDYLLGTGFGTRFGDVKFGIHQEANSNSLEGVSNGGSRMPLQ